MRLRATACGIQRLGEATPTGLALLLAAPPLQHVPCKPSHADHRPRRCSCQTQQLQGEPLHLTGRVPPKFPILHAILAGRSGSSLQGLRWGRQVPTSGGLRREPGAHEEQEAAGLWQWPVSGWSPRGRATATRACQELPVDQHQGHAVGTVPVEPSCCKSVNSCWGGIVVIRAVHDVLHLMALGTKLQRLPRQAGFGCTVLDNVRTEVGGRY
mmetsp:Transcript_72541/g.200046  ORF Transcript_72541/g.200046 Transcript_72541/m.200046 type:complete len:212 (+) Transcript_72541:63-698(+)